MDVPEDVTYKTGTPEHFPATIKLFPPFLNMNVEEMHKRYETCHEAFQIAECGGEFAGACMGTALNEREGFIDLLLVDEKFRKKGIGGKVLVRCVQGLGDRNVSLYCVQNIVNFYKKYGFTTGDHPCRINFQTFKPNKTALRDAVEDKQMDIKLVPLKDLPLKQINDYDMTIHTIDRVSWLKDEIQKHPGVAAMDSKDTICGYGILTLAKDTYSFSPLLAETPDVAAVIADHLLQMIADDGSLEVSVYQDSPEALSLAKKFGFPDDSEATVHLMYNKNRIKVPVHKVFSIMQGSHFA